MIVTFWTVIIFVLFNWPPNGLCLNFNVANEVLICRAVPSIGSTVLKKTADLKCWTIPLIGQTGEMQCVLIILNTTRNYVHLTSRNCDIARVKYPGSDLHCVLPNAEARLLLNGTSKKFGKFTKISSKYIVYFINSTRLIRNAILSSRRYNGFKWRSKLDTRYWNVFICSKRNDSIRWEKSDLTLRSKDRVFGKNQARQRRNILGNYNNSTAFSAYFRHTSTISHQVTPLLTTTVQSPTVTSRSVTVPSPSATDVWDLCPRSVVVNRSTIFVTPTVVGSGSLVATSQLTPLTHFTTTAMLRNTTHVAQTSHLGRTPTLALNATPTWIITHLEKRTQNATYIYNNGLVSVIYTTQGSAFITTFSCPTVMPFLTTTQESLSTPNTAPTLTTTSGDDKTKYNKFYVGLIAGGGVVLFIIICIAMFLLVRRYRRIQALRRTAKHLSYFNRFDCSSAWDEPDRFGGSKLSVFTLKNSKFDIDWESTHDSKQ